MIVRGDSHCLFWR